MKAYFLSLAVGVVVGIVYALFQVRSPAPPVIALVGLLGILVGEQLPSMIKHAWADPPSTTSWLSDQVKPHAFGSLPTARPAASDAPDSGASDKRQGQP